MNDWTLIESAIVLALICLPLLIASAVYGIVTFVKRLYSSIQSEIEYRYYFRRVRNPKKYAKMRRGAKEPMWDFLLNVFAVRR